MTAERRREPRVQVKVKVEVFQNTRQLAELYTRDLSASGLFLFYPKNAPLGDFLSLRLSLGERELTVMSEVVHSIPGMGMGLRFFNVDGESQAVLEEFLRQASE